MPNQTTSRITKQDLDRIEASLKQVIEVAKTQKNQSDIDDVIKSLSTTIHHLQTKIEFDHEKRLSAIEDFLQNL